MQSEYARKNPEKIAERNHDPVEHVYKSERISHAVSLTFTKAPAEWERKWLEVFLYNGPPDTLRGKKQIGAEAASGAQRVQVWKEEKIQHKNPPLF